MLYTYNMSTKRNITPSPQIVAPSMFTIQPAKGTPPQTVAPLMFTIQPAKGTPPQTV